VILTTHRLCELAFDARGTPVEIAPKVPAWRRSLRRCTRHQSVVRAGRRRPTKQER
jgi:hypothetical protein